MGVFLSKSWGQQSKAVHLLRANFVPLSTIIFPSSLHFAVGKW